MPNILSEDKAIFIACTVLNPFISDPRNLLNETDGNCQPIPDAEKIRIDTLLADLHTNDQKYDIETLDFILNAIVYKCQEEGFVITLEKEELAGRVFETLGDVARRLTDTSMPIWI